jgi:FkbM family methyltransferase
MNKPFPNPDPERLAEMGKLVRALLSPFKVNTFFDVGANVGQTVQSVLTIFPDAQIWAFEPVKASYDELVASFGRHAKVTCHKLALGAESREALMVTKGTSTANRIVTRPGESTEAVTVTTGVEFVHKRRVKYIDYLKIDAEGHDLKALVGFQKMLSQHRIGLIEVEAGMHFGNTHHVPFEAFKGYLEPMGYLLFRIRQQGYEQQQRPHLRRCNMVFVSEKVVDQAMAARDASLR